MHRRGKAIHHRGRRNVYIVGGGRVVFIIERRGAYASWKGGGGLNAS
jgi:hypothetical protein